MKGDRVEAERLLKEQQLVKAKQVAKIKTSQQQTADLSRKTAFAPGHCTSYVASRARVTWFGNAGQWGYNAKAQGYLVDKLNPKPGDIVVTNESWWGHVGYIESVTGTQITFSEQNYAGLYVRTTRTLDLSDPRIKSVIHLN